MTTRLVREITESIADPKISLPGLLRKAKILSVTLHNHDLKQWATNELEGYGTNATIPDYREVHSPVLGNYTGPFGSSITGYPLPVSLMPEFLQNHAKRLIFGQSLKTIEAMCESDDLRHPWLPEAVMLLRDKIRLTGGYELIEVYQPIAKHDLEGILDAVRNRLLDFVLGLQEITPSVLDSDQALLEIPKETVSQAVHVSIYGNHNILASGSGISQTVSNRQVTPHDEASLLSHLGQLGLGEFDLEDLRTALIKDGAQPQGQHLGASVTAWLGATLAKAASGTWKVALTAAPELLTKALSAYYGWTT